MLILKKIINKIYQNYLMNLLVGVAIDCPSTGVCDPLAVGVETGVFG